MTAELAVTLVARTAEELLLGGVAGEKLGEAWGVEALTDCFDLCCFTRCFLEDGVESLESPNRRSNVETPAMPEGYRPQHENAERGRLDNVREQGAPISAASRPSNKILRYGHNSGSEAHASTL